MEQVTRTEYVLVHQWLKEKFGAPVACENPKCEGKSKKFQYALKAGKTHKKLRVNYMTLCHPCHVAYDNIHKNRGHVVGSPRLSMKLLWKLRGDYMKSSAPIKVEKSFLGITKNFLDFVESEMKHGVPPTH